MPRPKKRYSPIIAPQIRPGVLHEPEQLSVHLAVSNHADGMVQFVQFIAAGWLIVDAVGVEAARKIEQREK